jgi:hypothetical protein
MTSLLLCLPAQAWYNGDWMYRHRISTLNSQVNGDQTNFPVYLDLQHLPSQFFTYVDANGADIRMTAADGSTEIPYELVNLDRSSLKGELWFKAPDISSTSNSDFFIYYGNANGTAYEDFDEFGAQSVWSNGYNLVSHFNEDPSGMIKDSTLFSNSILSNGGMTIANSISLNEVFKAYSFDGTNDELDINRQSSSQREIQPHRAYNFDGLDDVIDIPDIARADNGSISFWFKSDSTGTNTISMIADIGGTGTTGLTINVNPVGLGINFRYGDGAITQGISRVITNDNWHHAAITWNASELKAYLDNDLLDTRTDHSLSGFSSYNQRIGRHTIVSREFNGALSDFRIYTEVLTHNEIKAIHEFKNISKKPVAWYKMDDTHPSIAFDSSGNDYHGTKTLITPSTFHYEGNDVPYSFQNSVGYSLATNIINYSNQIGFDAPSGKDWNRSTNINLILNSDIAPDGTNTATQISKPIAGNSFISQDNTPLQAGTAYTASFYAKAGTNSSVAFEVGDGADNTRATFNLAAQGVTLFTDSGTIETISAGIEAVGNQWFRCHAKFFTEPTWTGNTNFSFYSSGTPGEDHLIWGAQLEQGTNLSPVQITNGNLYAINFIPKDESKTNKDIFNGDLIYSGVAPDYALYNGSFAGEFDGVDDLLSITHDNSMSVGNGSYSVSFLTQIFDTSTRVLALKGVAWDNLRSYYIYSAAGNWALSISDGSNSSFMSITNPGVNTWHRVTMIVDRDRNELFGYINNILVGNLDIAAVGITKNTNNLTMGQYPGGTLPFNGQIADFRVFNKNLTENEINQLSDPNFDLTENTVLSLPFSEGNGTLIHDTSGNNNHGTLTNALNGELFWSGLRQDSFHYNAKKGFTRVLQTDSIYPSGIVISGHTLPFMNNTEIEIDYVYRGGSATLFAVGSVQPFRIYQAGDLRMQFRTPDNNFNNFRAYSTAALTGNQYYSINIAINKTNGEVTITDLLTNTVLETDNGYTFHPTFSTSLGLGRYLNSSGGQGSSYIRAIRYFANGTLLANWDADYDFQDIVGTNNPTSITASAKFVNIPALSNGNRLANVYANGMPIANPGGAFDNKAESEIFIPDSNFNAANGDILNIQKIFRTNDTGTETLLKKGNDNHGYELRINNGVIEFEAMNENGNFSVSAGTGLNDNQEHIVHVVFDPSSEIELFVDGQELNSLSISNPEEFINAYAVMIANPNNGSNFFSGLSDELRFSNHSIDPSWVNTEYENIFNTADFYLIDNLTPLDSGSNTMFWGGQ